MVYIEQQTLKEASECINEIVKAENHMEGALRDYIPIKHVFQNWVSLLHLF